jgi:uncharacterized protein YbbK (DUF523 family)
MKPGTTCRNFLSWYSAMMVKPPYRDHLPSAWTIESWPTFTPERPLRIIVSACLAGLKVGADGTSYGEHPTLAELLAFPCVKATAFCPENFSFGTPRHCPDIHGGDGHDVLAGRARVLVRSGEDWTVGMTAAAREMLRVARTENVRLAVLMDISAACGSQVIYAGGRPAAPYRVGWGVAAALLAEAGIPIVSQRDWRTLDRIFCKLDASRSTDRSPKDHHESDWYHEYFASLEPH